MRFARRKAIDALAWTIRNVGCFVALISDRFHGPHLPAVSYYSRLIVGGGGRGVVHVHKNDVDGERNIERLVVSAQKPEKTLRRAILDACAAQNGEYVMAVARLDLDAK